MTRDLASLILRSSVGSLDSEQRQCSSCRRTPLVGELVHVLPSDGAVCALCLEGVPEHDREALRSERVHASERPLAVVTRPPQPADAHAA